MRLLGRMTVAADLTQSEIQVRTRVGREVKQHANCSWVGPFFIKWFPILVGSDGFHNGWGLTAGGFLHPSVVDDLLDQPGLGEVDSGTTIRTADVDSEKTKDVTIVFQSEVIAKALQLANIVFNQSVVRTQPDLVVTVV